MIDLAQWKSYVVLPSLAILGAINPKMSAPWAINQLVGTTKESAGLTYLYQVPSGPAIGPYQMEPDTYDDIWRNWLAFNQNYAALILKQQPRAGVGQAGLMFTDMQHATIMARLCYWRSTLPAPANTPIALATYHKVVYNTSDGASVASEDVDYYQMAIAA